MLIIAGTFGNYIQFRSLEEANKFSENVLAMIKRNEAPLVFGWSSDSVPAEDFNKEYDAVKGIFANELIQAIREGKTKQAPIV